MLWLVRHGSVEADAVAYGDLDVRLSEKGREETNEAVQSLAELRPLRVLTSPLARAHEMGQRLALATGAELAVDPRCQEMHRGEWQGLALEEYGARWRAERNAFWRAPMDWRGHGGETERELRGRVHTAICEWILAGDAGSSAPLVVTSHRQALRAFVGAALGLPVGASHALQLDCGAGLLVQDHADGWILERTNVRPPGARHGAQPDGLSPRDVF